jgi:hypothetical protein
MRHELGGNGPYLPPSSATVAGKVELATSAETITGTDTERAVTPAGAAATYRLLAQSINAQTDTTYTFVLADSGKIVTLTNGAGITATVPPNADVAFPIGSRIDLAQLGAGQVTVAQGAGVTVNATPGLKLAAQYSVAYLLKIATNTWLLTGDISA